MATLKRRESLSFTKSKFLSLTIQQQHKKSMQVLKLLYDLSLKKQNLRDVLVLYNQLQEWMEEELLERCDIENISNRFHEHLKKAGLSLKEHNLLPKVTTGDLSEEGEDAWPISIYLDNIRSAHNVGSIIRTVEGMRLGSLFLSEQTPLPTHKQVRDASMGATEYVSWSVVNDITELPGPIIALETATDAISIHDFIFPDSFTLVLGNEEYGCSHEILTRANYLVKIPMRGKKNSLNVANALSMVAQEIVRQRQES